MLGSMRLAFTKMHGLGNDFIVFDARDPDEVPSPVALRRLANRRTGIGFDQALVLEPPRRGGTDVYYRIFNADGSEVEQCGNGARCIARLVATRTSRQDRPLLMESPGGVVEARLRRCRSSPIAKSRGIASTCPAGRSSSVRFPSEIPTP